MVEVDAFGEGVGTTVAFNQYPLTAWIDGDVRSLSHEDVSSALKVVAVGREGYGVRGSGIAKDENVVPHDHGPVGGTWFVNGKVELWKSPGPSGLVGDAPATEVGLVFGGVVYKDVAAQDEIHGLVDPCTTASIAEGVPGHGDIRTALLDAHHATAVGAVDQVSRDRGVLAEFCKKEGAHAAT